jgi:beta-galactosidase
LVARDGTPKDAYYVFKSYWAKAPFAYIESHSWKDRYGKEGQEKEVCVYSNATLVELFLNGKTLGKRQRRFGHTPAHNMVWRVPFKTGNNTLKAIAFDENGKEVAVDTTSLNYHTDTYSFADAFQLSSKKLEDGLWEITARAVGENGKLTPDYQNRVYFSIMGDAELIENLGTYDGSSVIELQNGLARIKVKALKPTGKASVQVRTQHIKGYWIELEW